MGVMMSADVSMVGRLLVDIAISLIGRATMLVASVLIGDDLSCSVPLESFLTSDICVLENGTVLVALSGLIVNVDVFPLIGCEVTVVAESMGRLLECGISLAICADVWMLEMADAS